MKTDTAPSQQMAGLLRTRMQGGKADGFASLFAFKDPPLLWEAGTKQFYQVLEAFTAVQICAACDARVSEWLFTLLGQKAVSPTILNRARFLKSVLTKKKRAAESIFSH